MDFTQDERNMMMLYSPGTRSGLCEALTLMKEQLSEDESELFALADSVFRKVSPWTMPPLREAEPLSGLIGLEERNELRLKFYSGLAKETIG